MSIIQHLKTGIADPSTVQGAILYAVLFTLLAWLIGRGLRLAVPRVLARGERDHFDRTGVRFLAQLARFAVYIVAFIAYAHLVPAFSGMGVAGLASVSVISVILGLAAQNTLGNLIAGISLLLYRPFRLGDRLQLTAPTGLETGTVESLTLGHTWLRTDDNRRIVIPNSLMASQTTINMTGTDPRMICSVPVGINYDSDIDKVRAVLLDLAARHPRVTGVCGCQLTQLVGSGLVLTLEVWCADALTATWLKYDLLELVWKRFALEGIHLPRPTTLVVMQDDRRSRGPAGMPVTAFAVPAS